MMGFGGSDIGLIRGNNEDAIFVSNEPLGVLSNLYMVADGMGGHNAGEVASSLAITGCLDYMMQQIEQPEMPQHLLKEAALAANETIFAQSLSESGQNGMGTTLTMLTLEGETGYYAHVGDSRLYLFRLGRIQQVTVDHTLVAEMLQEGLFTEEQLQNHPQRNMLTRAVGTDSHIEVDVGSFPVLEGDQYLLCSDGLTNMVSEAEILDIVSSSDQNGPEKIESLIGLAKQNGGADNISVILIC